MSSKDTHNGHRYRTVKARFRRLCESNDERCWICGRPIDYSLRHPNRWAFTVDHVLPTSLGGDPYDMHNMKPAHYACNSRRGNKPIDHVKKRVRAHEVKNVDAEASRDWL